MILGCSLHVSHKFSICLTHKVTSPRRRRQSTWLPPGKHIIGVDGVDDVEAYNNYDEMPLLTDFPKKISVVEKNLPKDILTWKRKGVKGKVVQRAS